jgi:hypothetical protein
MAPSTLTVRRARCTSAVPFLFPAAQLREERYHDGALSYNNPTILAIEEAKIFWGSTDTQNLVVSVGCGITRERHNEGSGPLSCCTRSFFGNMSASKQNKELQLHSYGIVRLDPALDTDVVSLDDFEAISRLQQSFSDVLHHDVAFVELLEAAAFRLLSSFFYFEVSQPFLKPTSTEHSITGMIRPRIPSSSLQHLYKHEIFQSLFFMVDGKPVTFSMPKKVNVRVEDLDSPIEILLCDKSHRAKISGSPMSITDLLEAQNSFYCRRGTRKRRIPTRRSSN